MIEVRTAYRVTMPNAEGPVEELARQAREQLWPELGWTGRVQQMLHGYAQQSLFVWSLYWPNLAAWERAHHEAWDAPGYAAWYAAAAARLGHGDSSEVFHVMDGSAPPNTEPGRIEVRSGYSAPIARLTAARDLMARALTLDGWSGQNQEMLVGAGAPGTFVWSSTWERLGDWEAAMAAGDDTLEDWFAAWVEVVDYGARREIFRNL